MVDQLICGTGLAARPVQDMKEVVGRVMAGSKTAPDRTAYAQFLATSRDLNRRVGLVGPTVARWQGSRGRHGLLSNVNSRRQATHGEIGRRDWARLHLAVPWPLISLGS